MISYKSTAPTGIVTASNSLINALDKKQKLIGSSLDSIASNGIKALTQESRNVDRMNKDIKQRNTDNAIARIRSASTQNQLGSFINESANVNLIDRKALNNAIGEERNLLINRKMKVDSENNRIIASNNLMKSREVESANNRARYLSQIANQNAKEAREYQNKKTPIVINGQLVNLDPAQLKSYNAQKEFNENYNDGIQEFIKKYGRTPNDNEKQIVANLGSKIRKEIKYQKELSELKDKNDIKNRIKDFKDRGSMSFSDKVAFDSGIDPLIVDQIYQKNSGLFISESSAREKTLREIAKLKKGK